MPRPLSQAILMVDGYNVIGAWKGLQRTRDRHGLEEARRELAEALAGYSAFQGYETEIVFDAQFRDTPGAREFFTPQVCICYTQFQQTADSYIEIACSRFRDDLRKFQKRLIVATSDGAQKQTILGYGAEWFSAQRLLAEVEAASHQVRGKQKVKEKPSSRFLVNSLDPTAQKRLYQMRFGKSD